MSDQNGCYEWRGARTNLGSHGCSQEVFRGMNLTHEYSNGIRSLLHSDLHIRQRLNSTDLYTSHLEPRVMLLPFRRVHCSEIGLSLRRVDHFAVCPREHRAWIVLIHPQPL